MTTQLHFFLFACAFALALCCVLFYIMRVAAITQQHNTSSKAQNTMHKHLLNNTSALLAQHATQSANAQATQFAQLFATQYYAAQHTQNMQYYIFDAQYVLGGEGMCYVAANTSILLQVMQALNACEPHLDYIVLYLTQAQFNAIVALPDPALA